MLYQLDNGNDYAKGVHMCVCVCVCACDTNILSQIECVYLSEYIRTRKKKKIDLYLHTCVCVCICLCPGMYEFFGLLS